ncbi:SNF2 family N-terminal domain-containing protein [Xylariaceae sp. FL1651]|nr:SNF2 family N-terminal domain-containing protein [Xylariaceae sp. FL1651]
MKNYSDPTKRTVEFGEQDTSHQRKKFCPTRPLVHEYCSLAVTKSSDTFTISKTQGPEDVDAATTTHSQQLSLPKTPDWFYQDVQQPLEYFDGAVLDAVGHSGYPLANDYDPTYSTKVQLNDDPKITRILESNGSLLQSYKNCDIPGNTPTSPACTPSIYGTSELAPNPQSPDDTEYDTCFGVVTTTPITSSHNQMPEQPAPMKLVSFKTVLKIYFEATGNYAGILAVPALCSLLESHTIKLKGYLSRVKPEESSVGVKRNKASLNKAPEHLLRIVVYGFLVDRYTVGKSLSDSNLYLQHPSRFECDLDVNYFNPHYLVRIGGGMPTLEELSLNENTQTVGLANKLDETAKNRLLSIFDYANGAEVEIDGTPSSRLQTPLMEHQIKALGLMIEKEAGRLDNLKSQSLWLRVPDEVGRSQYRHVITGASNSNPSLINGGIIADEMGLGKTLSMLALICSRLDSLQVENVKTQKSRATLIVAPKSTLHEWQTQITRHIRTGQLSVLVYHGPNRHRLSSQFEDIDIVLTTYEILRSEHTLKGPLFSQLWWRIVLDEAHHIRNRESQAFEACCQVRALYRWCLTGTPVQNSLQDYGALLSFLRVDPFQGKRQFDHWIATPFSKNQPSAINNLRRLVAATSLRRTKASCNLSAPLPLRNEKIQYINLLPKDQELYDFFKEMIQVIIASSSLDKNSSQNKQSKRPNILSLITLLRLICSHANLLPHSAINLWNTREVLSSEEKAASVLIPTLEMYAEDIETQESVSTERSQSPLTPALYESENTTLRTKLQDVKIATGFSAQMQGGNETIDARLTHSAKIEALLTNLSTQQANFNGPKPPKSVIFSSWIKMLDQVQQALRTKDLAFQRIDGQSSLKSRSEAMRIFNKTLNARSC